MDEKILQALRAMAWERAKGELQAALHTYYSKYKPSGERDDGQYQQAAKTVREFIQQVEDNGLLD